MTEDMPGAVFLEDVIRGKCCCLRCGCRAARWLVPVCANLDVAGVGCEREQRSWVWARTMRGSELRVGGVNQDLRPPGACAVRATLCDNGELGADGRSEAGQPVLAAARAWQGTRHGTHQTRPRRQLTAVSRG